MGRSQWCAADGYDLRWDMARNIRYHREQKQMLDHCISEYRRPTPAWLAWGIIADGGLVIATCGDTPETITLGVPDSSWSAPIAGVK